MIRYAHTIDRAPTTTEGRRVQVCFEGGQKVTVAVEAPAAFDLEAHRRAVREAVRARLSGEFQVYLGGTSRHGFKFQLHEVPTDRALAAWLSEPAIQA